MEAHIVLIVIRNKLNLHFLQLLDTRKNISLVLLYDVNKNYRC